MAVSGLQKLTVAAALVLCAALILPKLVLRRDTSEETGRGQFPPMMQRHVTPDLRGQRGHGEVRGTGSGGAGSGGGGAGTGSGLGGKSNLAAQIIPVYGFGILLYILYILFKITSKGHSKPSQSRLHSLRSESSKRKITDFELSQLQERLRETELVMENLVNNSLQEEEDIAVSVSLDQEQSLLQQLTEITRAMKSNHLQDFTNTTSPTEETESQDDFDPFWSHCNCTCPQTHEEEEHLEEQQTVPEGLSEEDQETKEDTRETEPQTEEEVLRKLHKAGPETGDAETGDAETGDAETGDAETGDAETGDAETRTMKEEELQSAADEETALEEEEAERRTPEQQLNCGDVLQEETFSQASEEVRPGGGAAPSGVRRRNRRRRRQH